MGTYAEYAACPQKLALSACRTKSPMSKRRQATLQGMTAHYLTHSTYPIKKRRDRAGSRRCRRRGSASGPDGEKHWRACDRDGGLGRKAKLAREAGADAVILYADQDFASETKRLTDGKGVHVVYDGVGKSTFEKGLNVLRPRGYMVLFGGASGAVPPFDPIILSQKGSLLITRPTLIHYVSLREELEQRSGEVFTTIGAGKLKLRISQTYKLEEVQQAHRDLEGRKTTGKILLAP